LQSGTFAELDLRLVMAGLVPIGAKASCRDQERVSDRPSAALEEEVSSPASRLGEAFVVTRIGSMAAREATVLAVKRFLVAICDDL
jgi:hypothetical protein